MARLIQSIFILFAVSAAAYGLIGLMPGDPIALMINSNPHISAESAARLKAVYGLDQPLFKRFFAWFWAVLHGDLGYSRLFARPVATVLAERLPHTLLLMGTSLLFSVILGIGIAVLLVWKPRGWMAFLLNGFSYVCLSLPTFWLALLLIMFFSVFLGWLPASSGDVSGELGLWPTLRAMLMPTLTLALINIAVFARYVRGELAAVMQQDFMRTAKAKGLSEMRALWRHAMPHAFLTVITLLGMEIGNLFSGAVITETVFGWPGMGKLIFDSILGNDYNLALAGLLLGTAMTLLGNWLADTSLHLADPRLNKEKA